MNNCDVIDLCESSEDETFPTAPLGRGSSTDNAICIDSSDDESSHGAVPMAEEKEKEEEIEHDDDVHVVVERVVHVAAGADMTDVESDYDSSDDELDLMYHKLHVLREEQAIQRNVTSSSTPSSMSRSEKEDLNEKKKSIVRPAVQPDEMRRSKRQTQVPIRLREDFLHDINETRENGDEGRISKISTPVSTETLSLRSRVLAPAKGHLNEKREAAVTPQGCGGPIEMRRSNRQTQVPVTLREDFLHDIHNTQGNRGQGGASENSMSASIESLLFSSKAHAPMEQDSLQNAQRLGLLSHSTEEQVNDGKDPIPQSSMQVVNEVPKGVNSAHDSSRKRARKEPVRFSPATFEPINTKRSSIGQAPSRLQCSPSPPENEVSESSAHSETTMSSSRHLPISQRLRRRKIANDGSMAPGHEQLSTGLAACGNGKKSSTVTSRAKLLADESFLLCRELLSPSGDSHTSCPLLDSTSSSDFMALSDSNSDDREHSDDNVIAENEICSRDDLFSRKTRKRNERRIESGDIDVPVSQTHFNTVPRKRRRALQSIGRGGREDQGVTVLAGEGMGKRKSAGGEPSDATILEKGDQDGRGTISGGPTKELSVWRPDGTIHDLKMEVKKSDIPNSGMGTFLTYLGARVLKDEMRNLAVEKRASPILYSPDTMVPLDAISPDGFGITVKLTGKNLWADQNLQRSAAKGESGKIIEKTVGDLSIPMEEHYVSAAAVRLGPDEPVDLGRYGPEFRKDRKSQSHYDVKNFIFDHAPAEYGVEVSEKIGCCTQVIDITDDATGTRHEAALRLPLTYINEVGHNSKLKANIQLKEKDGRSMHCYFVSSLKKGETVELLADYNETYEDIRERKGYGKANIENGLKSNDHEPTALMRRFGDRQNMILQVDYLSVFELFQMTEFIVESILELIEKVIENYLIDPLRTRPTHLQWAARLRIHWLSEIFSSRIECLSQELPEAIPSSCHPPYPQLLEQARKWAKQMQWPCFGQCISSLAKRDDEACIALRAAAREDTLYLLSEKIVSPLDESMWCPTAVSLIKNLCDVTTTSTSLKGRDREHFLLLSYLEHAKEAERKIRVACRDLDLATLRFVSVVEKDEIINESSLKSFKGFDESDFFHKHTTFRKGILASLLEIQCLRDKMDLGLVPDQSDIKLVPQSTSHEVLMVEGSSSSQSGLAGYPQHGGSFAKNGQKLNEDWYLSWQVVYVVHCFAAEFIMKSSTEGGQYSLERLCSHIGVDCANGHAVIDLGIETNEFDVSFESTSQNGKSRFQRWASQKKSSTTVGNVLFDRIIWRTLEKLGWRLDVGTRPRDFYFLPKGVERCRGFSNRKDYFDSTKLVMNFIKTDPRWKDRPEIVEALELFDKVTELKDKLRLPGTFDVDELIRKIEESESSRHVNGAATEVLKKKKDAALEGGSRGQEDMNDTGPDLLGRPAPASTTDTRQHAHIPPLDRVPLNNHPQPLPQSGFIWSAVTSLSWISSLFLANRDRGQ